MLASTKQIFVSLATMPGWAKIFLEYNFDKPYNGFLQFLIDANFFE